MNWVMYVFIWTGILLVIYICYKVDYRNKRQAMLKKLREDFGKRPTREYEYEEFDSFSHYFRNRLKGEENPCFIDDITWNDLDMDTIFMLMNQTYSSPGQEYLYEILRRPQVEEEILKERNQLIEFYQSNEKKRIQIQMIFAKLGRARKVSVTDYIDHLSDLERHSNLPHILMALCAWLSIVFLLIKPQIGIILLIVTLINNVIQYYKAKSKIEPYMLCFHYLLKMLNAVEMLERAKIPEIEVYMKRLSKTKKQFKKFRKFSHIITVSESVGGSIEKVIMDYFCILFHIDLIKFNQMLQFVQENIENTFILLENLGILESAIGIASFRENMNYYTLPELERRSDTFLSCEALYHPMIEEPVPNDFKGSRGVLITGSNASGKSTFLKTVAINAILAQTIHTTLAKSYHASYFQIYSSMALQDSLESNESYYMVEIKSLKRILDVSKDIPMLCFIDEVLRGTNTVERIAASAQILRSLGEAGVMCFAATHDIEQTYLLESLYDNYHFQEEIVEDDILFSYFLNEGRATTRNAIQLLRIIGYENEIIENAQECAKRFVDTGEWSLKGCK